MAGRRRMATGYGPQTWIKRCDELGGELWRYQEQGLLSPKDTTKVAALLEEASRLVKDRYMVKRGYRE